VVWDEETTPGLIHDAITGPADCGAGRRDEAGVPTRAVGRLPGVARRGPPSLSVTQGTGVSDIRHIDRGSEEGDKGFSVGTATQNTAELSRAFGASFSRRAISSGDGQQRDT